MTRRLKTALSCAGLLLGAVPVSHAGNGQGKVTLRSLVSEMTDVAAPAKWRGDYKAAQVSSYDRRTVSPGLAGWFANNDGQGFERVDHIAPKRCCLMKRGPVL